MARYYVTTPIYYVNDAPHIGHAYTTITADALARWHRLKGEDVMFLTGTDEHGLKVQRSAEANGLSPQEQADRYSARFREAWQLLDISNDDYIRTTEPRHHRAVKALMQAAYDNGWITLGTYEGLYCVACEAYYVEDDLVDGLCPIHHRPVELLKESNYFFRLSAFADRLVEWYTDNPTAVTPEAKRNEALGLIKGGLQDISVTRTSLEWGVRVPWDEKHVFYVWYDALINYATAVGYGEDMERFSSVVAFGPPPHRQGHPAFPLCLLARIVHGGGDRPAPSDICARVLAGRRGENVQDGLQPDSAGRPGANFRGGRVPLPLLEGPAVRAGRGFFVRGDGRPLQRRPGQQPGQPAGPGKRRGADRSAEASALLLSPTAPWPRLAAEVYRTADEAWARPAPSEALEAAWLLVRGANAALEAAEPWRAEPGPAVDAVLGDALEVLRIVAVLASPALTRAPAEIWRRIGMPGSPLDARLPGAAEWGGYPGGLPVERGEPLFPRLKA